MEGTVENAIKWLRASFIAGAAADALVGVFMLIPGRMGETTFTYPMGLAASLMFGWTVLLLWGCGSPMERRGILLITNAPVIAGLAASVVWAFTAGIFPLQRTMLWVVVELSLIVLMGFSYWNAGTAARKYGVNL